MLSKVLLDQQKNSAINKSKNRDMTPPLIRGNCEKYAVIHSPGKVSMFGNKISSRSSLEVAKMIAEKASGDINVFVDGKEKILHTKKIYVKQNAPNNENTAGNPDGRSSSAVRKAQKPTIISKPDGIHANILKSTIPGSAKSTRSKIQQYNQRNYITKQSPSGPSMKKAINAGIKR